MDYKDFKVTSANILGPPALFPQCNTSWIACYCNWISFFNSSLHSFLLKKRRMKDTRMSGEKKERNTKQIKVGRSSKDKRRRKRRVGRTEGMKQGRKHRKRKEKMERWL